MSHVYFSAVKVLIFQRGIFSRETSETGNLRYESSVIVASFGCWLGLTLLSNASAGQVVMANTKEPEEYSTCFRTFDTMFLCVRNRELFFAWPRKSIRAPQRMKSSYRFQSSSLKMMFVRFVWTALRPESCLYCS